MVASVIAIILGVFAFVMFSKPVFWSYTGEGMVENNEGFKQLNCYDILNFESFENIYHLLGKVLLLIAMVFAGLMIMLALVDLIGRAAGNKTPRVEVRLLACGFFFFMLLSSVMFVVFWLQKTGANNFMNSTLGYGFLAAMAAALLSIFFAPSRRKGVKKEKPKKENKVQTSNQDKKIDKKPAK